MGYRIGPVRAHVQGAAEEIGALFDIRTIIGVAARVNESDHPIGLALDFMVPLDSAKGDHLADYAIANANRLGVKYVIWKQRIWKADSSTQGWQPMENRGSVTQNHRDHVHVSFNLSAGGGIDVTNPITEVQDVAGKVQDMWEFFNSLGKMFMWLNNPSNWLRIAAFLGGAALFLLGLRGLLNGN